MEPATIAAGSTFRVSSQEPCNYTPPDNSGSGAETAVVGVGTVAGGDVGVPAQFIQPNGLGDWSTTFTIPASTPAGTYWVNAVCMAPDQRNNFTYYNLAPIAVVAPG